MHSPISYLQRSNNKKLNDSTPTCADQIKNQFDKELLDGVAANLLGEPHHASTFKKHQ